MKTRRSKSLLTLLSALLIALCICSCGTVGNSSLSSSEQSSSPPPEPDPITVTVGATGDFLIHTPIITSYKKADGSYDFNDIFKYVSEYYGKFDYFVGNLEVTFGGNYCGYIGNGSTFNCPDAFADAVIASGTDMVLTANNHSYDTGSTGLRRTRDVLTEKGLSFTGSYYDGDKKYLVADVGGVKIGMINYTYQTGNLTNYSLNGRSMLPEDANHVNMFSANHLEEFYADMKANIDLMYADGAEAIMLYIHWGNEYHQEPDAIQKAIAQKMCDLGVDVIVGGHPHVIEPIDIISSNVSGKQTVCIYSTGNAVSNQRIHEMKNTGKAFPCVANGASEDGVIFSVSFTKKGNGEVIVSAIDAMPTWVNLYWQDGIRHYQIIPLDKSKDFSTSFNLSAVENGPTLANNSYNRTMSLLEPGLRKFETEYKMTDIRKAG